MKAQETAKYRLLAVDCCDGLVDAIKSRALGGCISAVLRASSRQELNRRLDAFLAEK